MRNLAGYTFRKPFHTDDLDVMWPDGHCPYCRTRAATVRLCATQVDRAVADAEAGGRWGSALYQLQTLMNSAEWVDGEAP